MTSLRVTIGAFARVLFWACLVFIVGNAVAQALSETHWITAVAEIGFFPITYLVYPFAANAHAIAWPLADGTSFVPALIIGVVAYPVSTFVGGLGAVE